ncbi:hypothetical protein LTR62_004551 [Meristemomyces frigidus]|uniref:Uncharacterized protein n=1 Tax=Meristemomyces frigidus TaxID=1508187 RepID=A0AAN7TEK8_9PEZI|nr:hypothetical protein LTR62_004551 [Meristemomyces frigidus]
MSGYYDPPDSRPPRPVRIDASSKYHAPAPHATGYAMPHVDRELTGRYQGQQHSSDSQYYPPPPPPLQSSSRRPGPPPRSPTARRPHSWPPPVTCEDEVASYQKEAGAEVLLREVKREDAPLRGTIDQEPIVQAVPELMNMDERRYILLTDSEKEGRSTGMLTPPTSEDESARRPGARPSRLNTAIDDETPELQRRTASPYSYTKPAKLHHGVSSTDQYLSPTTLTPPNIGEARPRKQRISSSKSASPGRRPGTTPSERKGKDRDAGSRHDEAITSDEYESRKDKSSQARHRTSVHDFAQPRGAPSTRRLNLDARRNTDTAGSFPTLPSFRVDSSLRPSPIISAGALGKDEPVSYSTPIIPNASDMPSQRSRESSYVSSRGVSPATSSIGSSHSPSVRSTMQATNISRPASAHSTAAVSASSSRPSSPSARMPTETARLPPTDSDWSTLLAANSARKTKPPSRLATQMRQESMPDVHPVPFSAGPGPRHTNSLPYPDEVTPGTPTMYMPSERDHQYFPSHKPSLKVHSETKTDTRTISPVPSNTSRASATVRPVLARGHSIANPSGVEDRPGSSRSARHDSFGNSSQTKKEVAALLKKKLPECSRSEPSAGYDDWYTVIGSPGLIICPDCVDSVFERTIFRPAIRRLPQLNLADKIGCAFGASHWLRTAWLLTLQQQRTDLQLLKDLVEIDESSEPCPGSQEAVRSWYGLRDSDGYFVRDFQICYTDVRKVERLLPTLNGMFVRLPHRDSYGKYKCAIRTDSNRFPAYLDGLIATHEHALKTRKGPDPMPFVELVEHKLRLRECTKDNMLLSGLWHFIPSIPTLTVCEDCYESIVEPEINKNSDVAMRFNRTVQPVYGEGRIGSSCQLYSRRMRRAFQRAVEDEDLKYLARKSKARREAEVRLQERYKELQRRAKRLSYEGEADEEDERRLNWEAEKITQEWQAKWE